MVSHEMKGQINNYYFVIKRLEIILNIKRESGRLESSFENRFH